jgi:EAL domain-containing protein (putative c-di-GMP-specific phosphodiesterase class I)
VIARSTIDLGRNLGLRVVAEGVETDEAWDTLVAMGCDVAQGYYFSPPAPADAITRWLADFRQPPNTTITTPTGQAYEDSSAFLNSAIGR